MASPEFYGDREPPASTHLVRPHYVYPPDYDFMSNFRGDLIMKETSFQSPVREANCSVDASNSGKIICFIVEKPTSENIYPNQADPLLDPIESPTSMVYNMAQRELARRPPNRVHGPLPEQSSFVASAGAAIPQPRCPIPITLLSYPPPKAPPPPPAIAAVAMEQSLGWQKAIKDLAGNHVQIREQYREIALWFPSVQMMRNHAHGLVKVMTEAEKLRAFPGGQSIPTATVLLWALREATTSNDPLQRARWWMYRSSTVPPLPDIHRVASRAEHVSDVVVALATPVNNTYWERLHPEILLGPSNDSDDEHVSDDESSDDFVELSDDEKEVEVEMVGVVVAAVAGDKEIPIDVEKLPDVRDLEAVRVTMKKELQDEEEELSEKKCKIPIPVKVPRSERLKKMQE
ncbi:hypothetical protein ZWY2020_046375 [Hordeum vulgare]|nr:hypothetical protein ZWY2020_046375 [Hordeum vulgare]